MSSRIAKGCFVLVIIAGLGILGLSIMAWRQMDAYAQLTPAQRAEADRKAAVADEANRKERLKGTDCEKLDVLTCYETRRKRKNLEAAAKRWQDSDMKKAYDDAGVR